ncbi:MAG TPA: terpene utilization protein AtuA, partial [Caulobacteraceae bacterium]|nr:terpene utilization protein AtuA [Caulobacteraceae bacterium]
LRDRNLGPYSETSLEVIGAEDAYGPRSRAREARDVILKLAAKHANPKALELLVRELTSSGTSMSPGITGMGGNRPKVMPVVRLFSALVDKDQVTPEVEIDGRRFATEGSLKGGFRPGPAASAVETAAFEGEPRPLIELAYGRSGDKGNNANIGIIARKREYLPAIRAALTPAAVADWFAHYLKGPVDRFDLPGVGGVNFLLHDVLAGGGTASLRNDPQGKTYAQILLDFPVPTKPKKT